MEAQSLDTQRNLATDFIGSLDSISTMRSLGIGYEFSLPFNKVLAGLLRLDFMAEMTLL